MSDGPLPVPSRSRALGPWAWALGWAGLALSNAVRATFVLDDGDLSTRLVFHAYDLAHFTVLALASVSFAALGDRLGRGRTSIAIATTAVLAIVVGALTLPDDLAGPVRRLAAGGEPTLWLVGLVVGVAMLVPAAELFGRVLARLRLRWVAVLLVVGVGTVDQRLLTEVLSVLHRHAGAHLFLAWGPAAVVAGAMADWEPRQRPSSRGARLGLAVAIVGAAAPVVVPIPDRALALMARVGGSVLFPYWSASRGASVAAWRPATPPTGEWYVPRTDAPDVPSSARPLVQGPPLVVLLTIDTTRYDALDIPDAARRLPNLTALRGEGVELTQARAPSTVTAATLSTMFAGKYFSQLYWEDRPGPTGVTKWPHADETARFPERLAAHGVHTIVFAATFWLTNEYGLVDGFAEEVVIDSTTHVGPRGTSRWASAPETTAAMIERLSGLAAEPARPTFLYAHYLEPHDPYDQAAEAGTSIWDRYIAEIAIVDAEIGRLRAAIAELGLAPRAVLIVTSDHGEAFGEHNSVRHGATLYDEVLHVPMLVHAAGLEPRKVDTPVSLVDVGPTVLDVFGVPTPGAWLGQSLVPLLHGDDVQLTRPIAFEARPHQGILLEDGTKIVRNLRYGVIEAFHLPSDPGERRNLFVGLGHAHDEGLGRLAEFFAVHEHRRPGYSTPARR